MTVLDGDAYAGEALMERLKPGEKRLISFALDLGTLATVRLKEDRAPTFLIKVVGGVFQAHYYRTNEKIYKFTNQTDRARIIFVEHPIRQGWELTDKTRKPDSKTARFYRFRLPLEAHQTIELPVVERQALMDSYALVNFTRADLELFIARNYIDAQTRAALENLIDIKTRIASVDARLYAINKEVEEISEDQERLRENIKALTATAEAKQLIARYVAKADTQESRIEQLTKDRKAASDERARLQAELDAAIRSLDINRNLSQ
jgi:organic radical activating enzyme